MSQTIGTPYGGPHIQAVAQQLKPKAKTKGAGHEYRWPLDVGERTIGQLLGLAPWLCRATIANRLESGERRLSVLIQRPRAKTDISDKAREAARKNFKKLLAGQVIAKERKAYFAAKKAGHKEL